MQRFAWRLVLGWVGITWSAAAALAQSQTPTPQQLLALRPTPHGAAVLYSTPADAELPQCKVELATTPKGSAWVLKDPQGRLLRKVAFNDGGKSPNEFSFYRDGLEVYREVISSGKKQPDRFYWLGLGGMKIGVDTAGDRKIDQWQAISVEELSQEVVRAVASKDWSIYQPLLITDAELAGLGVPPREVTRVKELHKSAPARFQQVTEKLKHLGNESKWLHLETGSPSRVLAEAAGMKNDVLIYYRALILCETAGKTDTIQLGEIVRVGDCWKLLDAPLTSDPTQGGLFNNGVAQAQTPANPELDKLLEGLAALDRQAPPAGGGPNPAVADYHLKRAAQARKIFDLAPAEQKLDWLRQIVDSYSAATQASAPGDQTAQKALDEYAAYYAKTQPGSAVAAFVAYRALTAEHAVKMSGVETAQRMFDLQNQYLAQLEKFVATYPKAEESADALHQMGMILELQLKIADARKWYAQCAQNFPNTRPGQKAAGVLRRLDLLGNPWQFPAGCTNLPGTNFNPAALRGKTYIVYVWTASAVGNGSDFVEFARLIEANKAKNLEVVTINIDDKPGEAQAVLQRFKPAGAHLYLGGGGEGPLAQQYGFLVYPNIFLVGRDGKVVDHSIDLGGIQEELQKMK
jgi:tetratricopeptide (TPR) repeat protein